MCPMPTSQLLDVERSAVQRLISFYQNKRDADSKRLAAVQGSTRMPVPEDAWMCAISHSDGAIRALQQVLEMEDE